MRARAYRGGALVVVLLVALALRWTTIDLPHFGSDEPAWEALATSLVATRGRSYTVRHVGIEVLGMRRDGIALVRLRPDERSHADVLDFYSPEHQDQVDDRPVSMRSPLYPVLLGASVAALGDGTVRAVAITREATAPRAEIVANALNLPRPDWRRAQLATILPSLALSLLAIALVVLATRDAAAGLVAGLALATAPLEAWCAHRVTADTLIELTTGLAAVLLARGVGRSVRWTLAAGAVTGLAVLAKSSGVLLGPAIVVAEVALLVRARVRRESLGLRGACGRVVAFGLGAALTGLWWPLSRWIATGDPLEAISYGGVALPPEAALGSWPVFALARPFYVAPATTTVLSPLLGLGGLALLARATRFVAARSERPFDAGAEEVALASVVLVFVGATMLWPARENRYLLPAYVALALGVAPLYRSLFRRSRGAGARGAVVVLFAVVLAYQGWGALRSGPSARYELDVVGPRWHRD